MDSQSVEKQYEQSVFWRRVYIAIIGGSSYFWTIWTILLPQEPLFTQFQWFLEGIPATLLFAWMLTLLSIELTSKASRRVALTTIGVLGVLIAGAVWILSTDSGFGLSVISLALHGGIIAFLKSKRTLSAAKIENSLRGVAFGAIGVWGATVGVVYSLSFGIQFSQAKLECTEVYKEFESLAYSPIIPLQKLSQRIVEPESVASSAASGSSSGGALSQIYTTVQNQLIEKASSSRTMLRDSLCESITAQIQNRVQNGRGVLGVVLVIFIIVSPLLSIIYRIASIFLRVSIVLLTSAGVYRREPKTIITRQLK